MTAEEFDSSLARAEQDLAALAKDLTELAWKCMGEPHESPKVWQASCQATDALRSLRDAIAARRPT